MRRVAQELGVGTMSLYYYVKTKDELIAVMDDALMAEALLPTLPRDWRRAMLAIAARTHSMFLRHPWAIASMQSAPPGVNAMRHMEQCLEALAGTSMTSEQKITLLATVDDFVFGHALRAAAADAAHDIEFARTQLATGAFPRTRRSLRKRPHRCEKGSLRADRANAAGRRREQEGLGVFALPYATVLKSAVKLMDRSARRD